MRAWLLKRGALPVASTADQHVEGGYTNPYTYRGVALALIMAAVVNATHDYATTETPEHTEVVAEIERVRLYNEVVLYAARLCEVFIKQLLYCTQIPESRYERKALGALLESRCPSCNKQSGVKPHSVSLVGTLAHPFHLCLEFDHCAMDHMYLVNQLRNSQAAHSGIQVLNLRSVVKSKEHLKKDLQEVLTGFLHMLSHLETLEEKILADLAEKAEAIGPLIRNREPEDCSFNLVPGERFEYKS